MTKFCKRTKLSRAYAAQQEEPSHPDQESENEDESAFVVRTDEWDDSDEEEESDKNEEEVAEGNNIYNIRQSSEEDSEEDSENEEVAEQVFMARFDTQHIKTSHISYISY